MNEIYHHFYLFVDYIFFVFFAPNQKTGAFWNAPRFRWQSEREAWAKERAALEASVAYEEG